ncbi:DNA polymerase III subunit alpha [Sporolactobacillus terrae]|uniref:DNA-directed DNA polymerase n=1 Tax=Sporolactobacillus terrae TaxID=269673 RepID=A0A5K7WYH5_9BACL|nr:DNA polymerase III subunit alpha [Sporolactobacillus terrae]BBN99427.1 DNA polymerase III subunit alpha [Sporolactobacillus terrae]
MGFVHLHVHSEYNLLDSTCRISDLVAQAKRAGQKAIAITDRNVMYGVVPFYQACRDAGLHPVIGMEVALDGSMSTEVGAARPKPAASMPVLVLLAQNDLGYQNLVQLSSLVQLNTRDYVSLDQLKRYTDGLIALSGGTDGPVDQALAIGEPKRAEQWAVGLQTLFSGRFLLEIQRQGDGSQRQIEKQVLEIAKRRSIRCAATGTIHYLSKNDAKAHACLRCIKDGTKLAEQPQDPRDLSFQTTEAMLERFTDLPETVVVTEKIAAACQVSFSFGRARLPHFPIPDGMTAGQKLREQCAKGLKERYSDVNETIEARLNDELSIIDQMGFNDYFLIVADLVAHARHSGYLPGPGRGSAAGSLVAYVLKITEVDPIRYHLLFERFLNPERVTMPDIDLDFPDVNRDQMIAYAFEKYGHDHVAQIITFGTLAAKAAIRDVGRALGTDPRLVDRMARLIPGVPKMTLEKAYKNSDKLKKLLQASTEAAALFTLARRVEGLPRHTSIHAAGVILSDQPLKRSVPIQSGHEGIPVTQYPMDVLESLGLLKIDFLGLRNLTFMREVLKRTPAFREGRMTIDSIPLDDPETFQLLCSGNTMGIFQLESEGMRQVLRKLKPTEFEDIVAVNALYRPGPSQFIDQYIRRKHGLEKVVYPHPDLAPILRPTYGVLVYQEQIMQIAVQMAGYTLGKADILRRAVGKKKRELLEAQKKTFISGCIACHYSEQTAHQLFDLIVRFANYGFNRSHAVAYSFLSYRLAYLKAHEPQSFMAAHLTGIIGNQEKMEATLRELRDQGIRLLPPSINESVGSFEPSEQAIRFGLSGIKNVGIGAIEALVEERTKHGSFKNLYDFCRRVPARKVNRKAIESMIFAGAFDLFGVDRAGLLATLDRALQLGEEQQKQSEGQASFLIPEHDEENYIEVPPLTPAEKMHYEHEALGLFLSAHPIEDYRDALPQSVLTVRETEQLAEGNDALLAVMVEQVKRIRTKSGQPMAFFSASDESGLIDTVCFPNTYEKIEQWMNNGQMLVIQAKKSSGKQNNPQLILQRALSLKDYLDEWDTALFLRIDQAHHQPQLLEKVKQAIETAPGLHRVILYYEATKRTVALGLNHAVQINESLVKSMRSLLGEQNVMAKRMMGNGAARKPRKDDQRFS